MAALSSFPPELHEGPSPPRTKPWGTGGVWLVGLFVGSLFVLVVVRLDGGVVEAQGGADLVHLHAGRGVRVTLLVLVGACDKLTHDDHPVSLVQVVEDSLGLVAPDHATVKRRGPVD